MAACASTLIPIRLLLPIQWKAMLKSDWNPQNRAVAAFVNEAHKSLGVHNICPTTRDSVWGPHPSPAMVAPFSECPYGGDSV